MLSGASIKVNLIQLQGSLSPHEISDSPEEQHDWQRKVGLEEVLGITQVAREWWANGDEELGCHRDEDEEEAEPGAVDATDGLEGNLIEGAALFSPGCAEADVGNTDRACESPLVCTNLDRAMTMTTLNKHSRSKRKALTPGK